MASGQKGRLEKNHEYIRYVISSRIENGDSLKPISAIINTIVTQIASSADPRMTTYELLEHVLNEFEIYSKRQSLSSEKFHQLYENRNVISKDNGKWVIENPANPKDNLADKWNQNAEIPRRFFLWVNTANLQLISALKSNNSEFRAMTESAFGHASVSKSWGNKYNPVSPKPITSSSPAKPWRV